MPEGFENYFLSSLIFYLCNLCSTVWGPQPFRHKPSVDFLLFLATIFTMKLIEDIKKAEEKAEKLKQEAESQGQKLLDKEHENGEKEFAGLNHEKEKLLEENLAQAKKSADKEIEKLQKEHEKDITKVKTSYKNNKNKSITKVQEIILKWPSSQ